MRSQVCLQPQLLARITNLMTGGLKFVDFPALETSTPLVGFDQSEKTATDHRRTSRQAPHQRRGDVQKEATGGSRFKRRITPDGAQANARSLEPPNRARPA